MAQYSIRDLEKLTGIKAHTIRIWEKRYNAVEPKRTKTNIRYYSDDDLKKLLNISILHRHGVKISKIMQKTDEELGHAIEEICETHNETESQIEGLVVAMIELDESKFEKLFTNSIIRFGFEKTLLNIIYPFLEKVGILWQVGNIYPAQEHFISNLIRQKLSGAIDSETKHGKENHYTYILFR